MNSRVLHLHIERIVVEGMAASAQHNFVASLERELTQMASQSLQPVLSGTNRRIASINAGVMRSGNSAEHAAQQVVQAIQAKISGGEGKRNG